MNTNSVSGLVSSDELPTSATSSLICAMHILYVLNYSINFLLYCAANKTVRKETLRLIVSTFNCKNLYWREWLEAAQERRIAQRRDREQRLEELQEALKTWALAARGFAN